MVAEKIMNIKMTELANCFTQNDFFFILNNSTSQESLGNGGGREKIILVLDQITL